MKASEYQAYLYGEHMKKKSKYGNRKQTYDGHKFDSRKEMNRYIELKLLEKANKVFDLQLQVPFILLEAGNGERGVKYIADFVYMDASGQMVVEDVKSEATKKKEAYILKRKMFKVRYPEYKFIET